MFSGGQGCPKLLAALCTSRAACCAISRWSVIFSQLAFLNPRTVSPVIAFITVASKIPFPSLPLAAQRRGSHLTDPAVLQSGTVVLDSLGIAFVSLRDNFDLTTPSGRLMFGIVGAMAEFERALIQERVKAG